MESRKTLGEWLDYIEAMHGGAEVIDLGLGRMTEMISRNAYVASYAAV